MPSAWSTGSAVAHSRGNETKADCNRLAHCLFGQYISNGQFGSSCALLVWRIDAASLLQVVMVEPVIAADGHTYEGAAIRAWLLDNTTSPVTRENLAHMRLVPNVLIRGLIIERGQ